MRTLTRSLLAALALALGASATIPPAAHAGEVPLDQRLQVTYTSAVQLGAGDWTSAFVVMEPDAPVGTRLTATISSCGRPLMDASSTITAGDHPHFMIDLWDYKTPNPYVPTPAWPGLGKQKYYKHYEPLPETANDFLGPTWEYAIVVTHPGLDPYTLTGASTVEDNPPARSCDEAAERFEHTLGVQQWSEMASTPKAGHKFAVTRTIAAGATVTYRWKLLLGGKKKTLISTRRSVQLKTAYKGKEVEVWIVVKQPGKRTLRAQMIAWVR